MRSSASALAAFLMLAACSRADFVLTTIYTSMTCAGAPLQLYAPATTCVTQGASFSYTVSCP